MDIVNRDVVQDAFVLSMISYAAALSLSKIYAKKHHYTVRANQEFFALGVSNFASSFFFCFPATASLSRASVMGELSRTQLSSLISCSILLQILLFLAPILTDLPKVSCPTLRPNKFTSSTRCDFIVFVCFMFPHTVCRRRDHHLCPKIAARPVPRVSESFQTVQI